ncbi:saccharopine dehydrogenase NADP-binding domain-containing protein [Acinetobacter sp. AYS6]|uniref:saccharopine dehydrogenase family protein n=1 Tax=Acinetobacter sp. AYS6 TaxID=2983297 RepID=UPI0021D6608F|nr:saccharopine dehydrogenase NADP-binding domain-containing protein [Acinetobacter sp. AYS6]MCU7696953.1 saccharopine dehydrogenase NADP-binding domain-containing protein [Acinetobacter sp. AYS6]
MNTDQPPSTAWLIYGANGYTGRLIAREAVKRGLRPILAGRSNENLESLARELDLPVRVFKLDDQQMIVSALQDVSLVLNCAGPFSATAQAMIQGCLQAKVHYLDVTGEIDVFEKAQMQHAAAQVAGIVICCGVGFDVTPTDCVAAMLKQAMPDASHLALGFKTSSPPSPGTSKTVIESLALGGMVRKKGIIHQVSQAWDVRKIDFGTGPESAMTIAWGDVSTAYWTTSIPNIAVYVPVPAGAGTMIRLIGSRLGWLWRRQSVITLLNTLVDKYVSGPDETTRTQHPMQVWGEVTNTRGECKTAWLQTANGYDVTINSALGIVQYLLDKPFSHKGYFTPSQLMGTDFISTLPGSSSICIQT